jgi:membrane-associated HD superfamily phosphohydrolase
MSDPANVLMLMLTLTLIAIVLLIFINVKAVLEKKRTLRVKILITCLLMGTALVMIFDFLYRHIPGNYPLINWISVYLSLWVLHAGVL